MKNFVRDDTQTNSGEMGLDRTKGLTAREVEDQRRRAEQMLRVLAGRSPRVGEAEAIQKGFNKREDGDTNWMLVAVAAELAKGGFSAIVTDDGETIIKKIKKG